MRLPYLGELNFYKALGLALVVYGLVGLVINFPNRLLAFFNLAAGIFLLWWVS